MFRAQQADKRGVRSFGIDIGLARTCGNFMLHAFSAKAAVLLARRTGKLFHNMVLMPGACLRLIWCTVASFGHLA